MQPIRLSLSHVKVAEWSRDRSIIDQSPCCHSSFELSSYTLTAPLICVCVSFGPTRPNGNGKHPAWFIVCVRLRFSSRIRKKHAQGGYQGRITLGNEAIVFGACMVMFNLFTRESTGNVRLVVIEFITKRIILLNGLPNQWETIISNFGCFGQNMCSSV